MLKHFFWDYFVESGDLEAYMMYKELECLEYIEQKAKFGNEINDVQG